MQTNFETAQINADNAQINADNAKKNVENSLRNKRMATWLACLAVAQSALAIWFLFELGR